MGCSVRPEPTCPHFARRTWGQVLARGGPHEAAELGDLGLGEVRRVGQAFYLQAGRLQEKNEQ